MSASVGLSVFELYFQLAPIPEYDSSLRMIDDWPSSSAQHALAHSLRCESHRFLVRHGLPDMQFLPPLSYQKAIYRYLEKKASDDWVEAAEQEQEFDDEFVEQCMTAITQASDTCSDRPLLFSETTEPQHVGFASYPVPFAEISADQTSSLSYRVPILIKKSFHQVGTKVWGAGLFLAELFQFLSLIDAKSGTGSPLRGKVLLELGAGVGVTGLLMAQGLPLYAQPQKIVMTDCFDEVLELMQYNISLLQLSSEESNLSTRCRLIAEHCDWSDSADSLRQQLLAHNPHFLFAADCTYSQDLNLLLIDLFELYLSLPNNVDSDDFFPHAERVSHSFLPMSLLQRGVRFVLIACTIRHPDTFAHFEQHLRASSLLDVADISEEAHALIAKPLYYYDFRDNIRLFCITRRQQ